MSRMLISLAALAILGTGAQAQTATPQPQELSKSGATAPAAPSPAAPSSAAPSGTGQADQQPGGGEGANQETYKTKDGSMYQPPKQRPASPAQDLKIYGRT